MNTKGFYDIIRPSLFGGKLSLKQFDGIEAILKEYNHLCVNDLRKLAYILATVYHETAKTMEPIAEYGKGKGYDYGKKLKMSRKPYTTPDQLYYGRGYPQLTWYENYAAMGKLTGYDLLNFPDLMLTVEVSVKVLFEGMLNAKSKFGDFTGKSLEMYFTADSSDPVNARKIVNGLDAADKIASYYRLFYAGLISQ